MSKTINDLREVLFDTLEQLRAKDNPMEIDRAKAISDIAGRLIDTAKVECQYVGLMGNGRSTGFIETESKPGAPAVPQAQALPGARK